MIVDYDLLRTYSEIVKHVITCGGVNPVVAGGAIRDMLLGRPIKDIDIFYSGTLDEEKLLTIFTKDTPENSSEYDGGEFQLTHPCLAIEDCSYPIQLIKIDDPHTLDWVCKNFGCNLSKVIFSGADLGITTEFLRDVEMEILTFPKPVSETYMKKMTDKYPDFLVNGTIEDECFDF